MGAPYSQDLRDRVLAACDRGMKTKQVAEVFAVSPAWVRRVKQRRREFGETSPRPCGGRTHFKIDRQRLAELVHAHPDATLKELREMLGARCAESTVCTALKKLGFSYKKRRSTRRSRAAPTSPGDAACGVGPSPALIRGG
jgi:transposase